MTCDCTGCNRPHPKGCRRKAAWYVELHPVDNCQAIAAMQGNVCQSCLDSYVAHIKTLVEWGREGYRLQHCLGCQRPVMRLSHVITDIAKV